MSEEQLKAFLEKVKADTSLQEKLKAAASPEAAMDIAKEAGFSITAEDIQSMQSESVNDEELESAAGGMCNRPDTGCIGGSVTKNLHCRDGEQWILVPPPKA